MPDQARKFDLYTILAITHGLPSVPGPYREILEFMTEVPVPAPSHAIGLVPVCRDALFAQHPQLRQVPAKPDFRGSEAAMDAWADEQKKRLGVTELPVTPLPPQRQRTVPGYMGRLLEVADPNKVHVHDPDEHQ